VRGLGHSTIALTTSEQASPAPSLEGLALGGVLGELGRPPVGDRRASQIPGPGQKLGPGRVQGLVAVKPLVDVEISKQGETDMRAIRHGQRRGTVDRDDWRRCHP